MNCPLNLLSVDLEEWYVVDVFSGRYTFDRWSSLPSTLVRNSRSLLELFRRKKVCATWFVLGWCAEQYPDLIREIAENGHEIACHSYRHVRVDRMDRGTFRKDTQLAVRAITDATGIRPSGYRAPSWSITSANSWAFEELAELGFEYDSSIFPIKHDLYGMPEGPRSLFRMAFNNGKSLWEIPSSTYRLLGRNIPVSGGGYLRHSPYWYSRMMINRLNARGDPVLIYIHPWEIDPEPPRVENATALQRFRMSGSTRLFRHKIERLLSDFEFTNLSDYIRRITKRKIGFERSDTV
jgi:polysaccharide deacetylase family protein (PEP-CTERM system associated)